MKYDGKLDIAIGMKVDSKVWKNKKVTWSELVRRLSEGHKTNETYKEFIAASKAEQQKIKDVGGYVGGYLRAGRRKPQNVVHRQLLTLDIDFAHTDFWDDFCMLYSNAAVIHATHKHHASSPRYRLIIPVNRELTPDEYVAVSRRIAGNLNIELFDNTTFEVNRLMFWPSCPKDVEYYFHFQDGPFIDADEVLDSYIDWTDSSLWPTAEKQLDDVRKSTEKQEDPETKKGVVGAFCRTYGIADAITTFLPDIYTDAGENRYTYVKGTTAGGLVVYNDKFAFSHHGTDPCSGKLCNAFDLVRIQKFGHLDEENSSGKSAKSYKAFEALILKDKKVKGVIAEENLAEVKYDFAEEIEVEKDDNDWMKELEVDARGQYLSTAPNLNLIFANDIRLKGRFKHNEFDNKKYIFGNMPWRRIQRPEPIKNVDFSGVRNYVESIYGITGSLKIEDALTLEFEKQSFHPIKEYLSKLVWDGKPRLNKLLVDYFGADDNIYTHEAIRKPLVGAVARVYNPGIKFDLVLMLTGEQGTGKSTFINKLGKDWYSDTFLTVQGKDALEQIQGVWIMEMAELSGLRKAEIEPIKHFLSKQEDTFRAAYARTSETYRRQCIFIGTTNDKDFLRDPSGNRRFLPVDINHRKATKSIFDDLDGEIDQIWAEAMRAYKQGEKLFMSKDAEIMAKIEQKKHSESDERAGIVEAYLNRMIPKNWDNLDIDERRMFLESKPASTAGLVYRDYVCVAEIWCECIGKSKQDMDRYKTRDINNILRSFDEWEAAKSTRNFSIYGVQKYYTRRLT